MKNDNQIRTQILQEQERLLALKRERLHRLLEYALRHSPVTPMLIASIFTRCAEPPAQAVRRRRTPPGLRGQPRRVRLRAIAERAFASVGMTLEEQK